ncbi:unnamed protein product [Gordionus sp. m RMFG-2023]
MYPHRVIDIHKIFPKYHSQLGTTTIYLALEMGEYVYRSRENIQQRNRTWMDPKIDAYSYLKRRFPPHYHQNINASCKRVIGHHQDFAGECLIDPITAVRFNFDRDILAFVHIQKAGGTELSSILVHNVQVNPGCSCRTPTGIIHQLIRCLCERPNLKSWEKFTNNITEYGGTKSWLYNRFSNGWKYCGIHPIFERMRDCLPVAMKLYDLSENINSYQNFIREHHIKLKAWHILPKQKIRKINL